MKMLCVYLGAVYPASDNPEGIIRKWAIEAVALTHQQQLQAADQRLTQADGLCRNADYAVCGDVLRARGILAGKQGQLAEARQFFLESFSFAQTHHDLLLEASASLNLGWAALQVNHFDEALDWSRSAYRAAKDLGAEDTAQARLGQSRLGLFPVGR
jgi:tetratricopeptide (TPR) repeat protein